MDAGLLALLGVAGVAAGIINTIAGGGSFLTLPLLMALGLAPGVANGTIRVGIVVQNLASVLTFRQRGVQEPGLVRALVVPMCLGALGGALLATRLPDDVLRPLFGALLLAWAIVLVVRPGKFRSDAERVKKPTPGHQFLGFLVGLYGGFLQAGVGFPLMGLLVLGLGCSPVRANSVKVALVLCYTLLAVPVFAVSGQIAWLEAGVLAAGTTLGGWAGTRWQIQVGAGLVRWFLFLMMTVSGVLMIFR